MKSFKELITEKGKGVEIAYTDLKTNKQKRKKFKTEKAMQKWTETADIIIHAYLYEDNIGGPIGPLLESGAGKRQAGFKGTDEIGEFWVVTNPTPLSEIGDILFKADVFDIWLQMLGGLKGDEIVGLYKKEAKAKKIAQKLLDLEAKKKDIK